MVSWLYSIVEMLHGSLPWSHERESGVIERHKHSVPDRVLLGNLPSQFREIWTYINSLEYLSKVNYDYIIGLLTTVIRQTKALRFPFDWEYESIEKKLLVPLPRAVDFAHLLGEVDPINEDDADVGSYRCRFCSVA
jgi:hypothetical protein